MYVHTVVYFYNTKSTTYCSIYLIYLEANVQLHKIECRGIYLGKGCAVRWNSCIFFLNQLVVFDLGYPQSFSRKEETKRNFKEKSNQSLGPVCCQLVKNGILPYLNDHIKISIQSEIPSPTKLLHYFTSTMQLLYKEVVGCQRWKYLRERSIKLP